MTELPAPNGIGHGLFAAGLAQANRAIEFPADGVERTTDLKGDPVIPEAAVVAGAQAVRYLDSATSDEELARTILAAALPHLRPLFEVATQGAIDWDEVENMAEAAYRADRAVIDCNDFVAGYKAAVQQSAERIKVATQVGLELGRQEAAEEIAAAQEAYIPDPHGRDQVCEDCDLVRDLVQIAREVATRTADARTDPSGHTDLPPTPDALSKRLPEACEDCGNSAPGIRHQVADPDPGGESATMICLWPCGHSVPISPTQCDCVPVDTSGAPY